jgi:hypothetical protein
MMMVKSPDGGWQLRQLMKDEMFEQGQIARSFVSSCVKNAKP